MSKDTIYRQDAIDALARTAREKFNLSDGFEYYIAGLMDGENAIRQLPSAKPESIWSSDLIDRKALMQEFSDFVRESNNSDFARTPTWNDTVSLIESMPSAQLERKKGKWIVSHVPDSMLWECNQCGFDCGAHSFNFCPNCGADMRGERNE